MGTLSFLVLIGLVLYIASVSKRVRRLEEKTGLAVAQKPMPMTASLDSLPPLPPLPSRSESTAVKASVKAGHHDAKLLSEEHSVAGILSKVGVVALLFGLAFFLKYAIDQGWISIWTRLIIGFIVGGLFLVLSNLWLAKYRKYSLALAGGGLAVLYLTIFAGYQYYHVISQGTGMVLMIIVTIIGIALAWRYDSRVLAVIAWSGGFLTPRLLAGNQPDTAILFSYLTILNVGVLLVMSRQYWQELAIVAFLGTILNFMVWYDLFGLSNAVPLATIFLVGNMTMILIVHTFLVRQNSALIKTDKASDGKIAAFFGFTGLWYVIMLAVVLSAQYESYRPLIMLLTAVVFGLAYMIVDRLEHININRILSFAAVAALVLFCYWQFQEAGQILAGLIVALVLLALGMVYNRIEIRFWAMALLVLVSFKSLFVAYPLNGYEFILNSKFGVGLASVIALFLAAYFYPKGESAHESEKGTGGMLAAGAVVLFWAVVSLELWHYFDASSATSVRDLLLSLWWLLYGVLLAVFGSMYNASLVRKLAIVFFGLAIVKVFLYDVQSLDMGYRVVSFISLGAILLAASFGYQRNKDRIKDFIN